MKSPATNRRSFPIDSLHAIRPVAKLMSAALATVAKAKPVVFFDVSIGGKPSGRIEMTVNRWLHFAGWNLG